MAFNPKALPIDDATVDRLYDQVFVVDLGVPKYVAKNLIGTVLNLAMHARKTNAPAREYQEGVTYLMTNMIPSESLTGHERESYSAIRGRLLGLAGRLLNGEEPSSL